MTDEAPSSLHISGDTLRMAGVAISIAVTLFGVIKFGTSKIVEYDSHSERIAKLEARESTIDALTSGIKLSQYQIDANKTGIGDLKIRIDGISSDVVSLRVSEEHLRTLLEKKK